MNKKFLKYTFFLFLLTSMSFGQTDTDSLKITYKNEKFKFEVSYVKKWRFYEFKEDSLNLVSRAEWRLPKKYAIQEENTILIEAYLKPNLDKVDDFYFDVYEKKNKPAGIEITRFNSNGLEIILEFSYHKEKIYNILKNGIGYVIKFNATSETYEKDLILFENLFTNIKFL